MGQKEALQKTVDALAKIIKPQPAPPTTPASPKK